MRSNVPERSAGWMTVTPCTIVRISPVLPPCSLSPPLSRSARNSDTRATPAQCSGPIPAPRQNASPRSSSITDGSPTRRATHCSSAANHVATYGAGSGPPAPGAWTMSHSTIRPFSEWGVSGALMRSGTR